MSKLLNIMVSVPVIGRLMLFMYRAKIALRYLGLVFIRIIVWLFKSKETTNFTYDLEENNLKYLAYLVSVTTNISLNDSNKYMSEILNDSELKRHILAETEKSDYAYMADNEVRFSKRIGWYMFARATKPRVIVETGVDKGLGSCVLAAALKRNGDDGHKGRYYGTDINPKAGYLFTGTYQEHGEILFGDSIESLSTLGEVIDLFINDSDHSAEYEAREYEIVTSMLSDSSIILGDNSHTNNKLMDYSIKNNRQYVLFREQPYAHWYPGGGIGVSWK